MDWPNIPPRGLTTIARIVDPYDGDTITVQWGVFEVRLRLRDCWAPEVRHTDAEHKRRGLLARDYLATFLTAGLDVTVHLPTEGMLRLGDHTSLGRYLSHVWIPNEPRCVSQLAWEAGYTGRTKDELQRLLHGTVYPNPPRGVKSMAV